MVSERKKRTFLQKKTIKQKFTSWTVKERDTIKLKKCENFNKIKTFFYFLLFSVASWITMPCLLHSKSSTIECMEVWMQPQEGIIRFISSFYFFETLKNVVNGLETDSFSVYFYCCCCWKNKLQYVKNS